MLADAIIMHLSIACPTTPLRGLGGAIARRLQQIFPLFRPQHRGLRQLQKMSEKVKVPTFSDSVKGVLRRSSKIIWCTHFFESEKVMESNEVLVLYNFYSRVAKTTGIVKMSRKHFLMFFH